MTWHSYRIGHLRIVRLLYTEGNRYLTCVAHPRENSSYSGLRLGHELICGDHARGVLRLRHLTGVSGHDAGIDRVRGRWSRRHARRRCEHNQRVPQHRGYWTSRNTFLARAQKQMLPLNGNYSSVFTNVGQVNHIQKYELCHLEIQCFG